jgi:hypothetical protein
VLGIRLALPDQQDEKKPYVLLVFHEQKYLVQMGGMHLPEMPGV